jgi:hypothetical protein
MIPASVGKLQTSSVSNPITNFAPGLRLLFSLVLFIAFPCLGLAQVSVTTYHNDNARTGQNLGESILTPANVNVNQFAKLYAASETLDSWAAAQPLYMPNVAIPGQGVHNVVYVATLNNSVYAFDADSGQQLWFENYGPPTPFDDLCGDSTYQVSPSKGAGIVGTPVIDPVAGLIYFVTKTGNGSSSPFALYLHAVYITTGLDEPGSPVEILPPSGPTFMPQYQMNRPGLLLNSGYVYVALGSTGCKGLNGFPKINNHGWVLGYNTLSLSETPYMFVTSPTTNNSGIWQSGGGLATDPSGNIYLETADGVFDENDGGSDYGLSVLKLSPQLQLLSFFTPYNEGTVLEPNDLDLSSVGPLLLNPPGSDPVIIASGKAEEIYVLDTDNLGGFCSPATCDTSTGNINILQDVVPPSYLSGCLGKAPAFTCRYGTPTYWSNGSAGYVYFSELPGPVVSYSLNGTTLNTTPVKSPSSYSGVGSGSISANTTGSGLYWAVTWANGASGANSGTLRAFDATNLQNQFYASSQAAGGRDSLGYVTNFITPTVANGKVFVANQSQLLVYGLLPTLTPNAGNNQSAYVGATLPATLSVLALNSYTNQPVPNVTVTFTASPSGGSFGSPSVVTNSSGIATTTYKLPTKPEAVTITASSSKTATTYFSETAAAGPAAEISLVSGGYQKGTVATVLPAPIIVSVRDPYNNLMPNAVVNFTDNNAGGTFNPVNATTNSSGQASSYYTLPTKAESLTLTATTGTFKTITAEQSLAGSATSVNYVSGNNQSAQPNTQLALPLVVSVSDQYGNVLSGVTVGFTDNGAGGRVSKSQVVTSSNGRASISYVTPSKAGTVNVTASVSGLQAFSFTVTVQ